jgi:UDP-N-acetylglucosamine:LPS N-acetylglucosamine transferase
MNAKSMVELGTAVLIEEKEIDGKLFSEVVSLLSDGKRIKVMVENLEKAGGKDAAFKIAGRVINACKYGNFS